MKRTILILAVLLGGGGFRLSAGIAESGNLPAADGVLDSVLARLPRKPVTVSGALQTSRRGTNDVHTVNIELSLSYGDEPAAATYTIRDAFGASLAQMRISHAAGKPMRLAYASGDPLTPAPPPALSTPVGGTDVSWGDMCLSFLWWRGGRTVGREMIKGQACYVLDVPAPAGEPTAYARIRLWIDEKFLMMLQAEGFDTKGSPIRRLAVRSFRKIGDTWMLKDLEVENLPSKSRTILRITDIPDAPASGDSGTAAVP